MWRPGKNGGKWTGGREKGKSVSQRMGRGGGEESVEWKAEKCTRLPKPKLALAGRHHHGNGIGIFFPRAHPDSWWP